MTIRADHAIPYEDEPKVMNFHDRVAAGAETARLLAEHGLDITPREEDILCANELAHAFAADPYKTSVQVTNNRGADLRPPQLIIVNEILESFGRGVVESSVNLRHLVTNKLIIETENADPRIRIRALELLGKITDVGLFTDRTEVTVTHQSTDDLRNKLRERFMKLRDISPLNRDREVPFEDDVIDVKGELGLSVPESDQ